MKEIIKADKLNIEDNKICCEISCSRGLKKYFSDSFYAKYDRDIENVNRSILQIPAISNIITVAWVTGADVYVKELDKAYLESLDKVKRVMKGMYPEFPFSGNIYVDKIVSNSISGQNQGSMLLFTGGIDSTTSYIRHKNEKPTLVTIWGADIPLSKKDFWNKAKKEILRFADKEGVEANFIETNIFSFMNMNLLSLEYGRYLTTLDWWESVQHGIGLLGLCAPLATVERIGMVYIASSLTHDFHYPLGLDLTTGNNISWANVKVSQDGYELTRQEKIRYAIKNYIRDTGNYPFIRVCNKKKDDKLNCSDCEKCYRAITGLVLEGIDPNNCGFTVDSRTFYSIKRKFINRKFIFPQTCVFLWKDIQRHIPETIDHNLYNSKEFFRWLKDFDIVENNPLLYSFYFNLPKSVHNILVHTKILQLIARISRKAI